MARQMRNAKRANRPNPREDRQDRNVHYLTPATEESTRRKKVQLLPRNIAQEKYIDLLENPNNDIIIASGPAGCGKTYLATLYAIQELRAGNIKKIVVTRPLVANGENIGALPGDLMAKLAPWCVPVLDIFKEVYAVPTVKSMLENEVLELASLGLMRGRTFKDTIVIGDEMQNATVDQVKMLMTRIGEGSRMIITGDVNQHDRSMGENGLRDILGRIDGNVEGIVVSRFNREDVERHRVIETVLKLYGE